MVGLRDRDRANMLLTCGERVDVGGREDLLDGSGGG